MQKAVQVTFAQCTDESKAFNDFGSHETAAHSRVIAASVTFVGVLAKFLKSTVMP